MQIPDSTQIVARDNNLEPFVTNSCRLSQKFVGKSYYS